MAEMYPSDTELAALSNTTDPEQEVLFIPTGESPYHISFYKMQYRLLDVARRAGDLRVYKDGNLTFGVRAGLFMDGATVRSYAGSTGNVLTNNQTNYIYLTADATLTINTTGFPAAGTTPHIPLATILTAAGDYDPEDDVTDYRARSLYAPVSALTPAEANKAHDFFSATDLTGAQAETLSDGSNADALHVHDTPGLETGAVTAPKQAPAAEQTVAASNFTLAHGGASEILITHATAAATFISDAAAAIADGSRVGHTLRIALVSLAGGARVKILDGANTKLRGDWYRDTVEAWLTVVWDGSDWIETGRNDGDSNSNAGGIQAASEGTNADATGDAAHAEGTGTTASGAASHAEGQGSDATGSYSHAEGNATTASGNYAHAEGDTNTAEGTASHAQGYDAKAALFAQDAHACGEFAAQADAQRTRLIMRYAMTAADGVAWKELILPERFAVADEKAYACTITLAGRQDTGAHHAMYKRMVLIERTGGTVALAGAVQTLGTDIETDAAWDVQLTADDANKALKIEVKGNSQNIRWVAHVEALEIAYAD